MPDTTALTPGEQLQEARRLACSGWPARAYELARAVHERAAGDALLEAESADCLVDCCLKMARYERGIEFSRKSAAIWQARGETARLAHALALTAELLSDIGAPDAAAAAKQAMRVAERSGDAGARARALMTMGLVLFMAREPEQALPFNEQAVTLSRREGLNFDVAWVNYAEAILLAGIEANARGEAGALAVAVARAVAVTREALAAARRSGDGWLERLALNNIAEYSIYVGDTETAEAALGEIAAAPGEPTARCAAQNLNVRAKLLAAQGRLDEARAALEACLAGLCDVDYLEMEVLCLGTLADVLERMGLYQEALAAHRKFHASFVRKASEGAQRLARVAAYESENRALRDEAGRAHSLAASLVQSNLELAREAEQLLRATLEDPLTGLPNRRRFDLAMAELAAGSAPFAIAMLDVDHFKQINDRFTHAVGDAVLRKIGGVIGGVARHSDLVARYGGEEFVLIIRTADPMLVSKVCERLRERVENADWNTLAPGLRVTASLGIGLSSEADHPDKVLKLADTRLYAAKRGGRNRVAGPGTSRETMLI